MAELACAVPLHMAADRLNSISRLMSEEQQSTEDAHAGPAKPTMLLLIAGLVGGLVIGGLGGSFALGPMLAKKLVAPTVAHAATDDEEAASESKSEGGGHGEKGEKKAGAVVHMMENLVLNPSGSNGTRFLMAAVAAEVKDEKVKEEMTGRDAELRDAVLRLLGDRTVDQLSDMAQRDALKKTLTDSLNSRLASKSAIKRVYFPQFVIQ
jgi:flagellar FliL protein